ncbi:MAG TPA: sigma 54-interacting transcriptional regulator, partial [Lacipirellulaceae bacterium]|nr:sigma 54-interacting transcriptional regulator [Lacipirellulaceae bacterium]
MIRFREVLLAVWREACQHIEMNVSAAEISALLAEHIPLARLAVELIDVEHRQVSTVAAAPPFSSELQSGRREYSGAELKKLAAWAKRGAITAGEPDGSLPPTLDLLSFPNEGGDLRIVPLASRSGTLGALLVSAGAGQRFSPLHEQMLESLREPFAVALENDRRLHEMNALREAAEADRRMLLRRLGRPNDGESIVGEAGGLAPVIKRVDLVSTADAPVLLLGETGAGKEVIARAIHTRSERRDGPFIRVNCGAIPRELIDSQLFGHEKGSFTGATESRQGWFERADGGTLFLDEIGELPLEAQVRFLRVLQDSYIERVGGRQQIHVDVRVVAATHRDLSAMVRDGRFREDLWYRIAVFPILLPPLRERLGDIPALAAHFAERAAVKFGLPTVLPTEEDVAALRSYHWPGNIRELATVIDRAAILGEGRRLEIGAALGFGTDPAAPASARSSGGAASPRQAADGELVSIDEAVRRHIVAALQRTQGRVEGRRGAAALLKINPHTLRARMRKLGVDWAGFRPE